MTQDEGVQPVARSTTARKLSGIAVIALLAWGLYPADHITVPRWKIQFVDPKNIPLAGLPVEEIWRDYSAEDSDNREKGQTDEKGFVTFSERHHRSPRLYRYLIKPVSNILSTGVHASFGRSAFIVQPCSLIETGDKLAAYWGQIPPERIPLKTLDTSYQRNMPGYTPPPPICEKLNAQIRAAEAS